MAPWLTVPGLGKKGFSFFRNMHYVKKVSGMEVGRREGAVLWEMGVLDKGMGMGEEGSDSDVGDR